METGISTASIFNRAELYDQPALIKAMGCSLIEVFLNTFSEYEPGFIRGLKDRIEASGLRVYSVHPMSTQFEAQLFSIHKGQKQDALAVYRKVLAAAKTLGAAHYVMHGSPHLGGAAKNLQVERLAPVFEELIEEAQQQGIRLCLENVSWCFFNKPAFGEALKGLLKDSRLGFVLDIKQAARSGEDPFAFLQVMDTQLANVHICDYVPVQQGVCCKLVGEGSFPFDRLKGELKRIGYKGPAFLELYSDMYRDFAQLRESYQKLKQLLS